MNIRKSRFMEGDSAILTNNWPPFTENQIVTVDNPNKQGKDYKVTVHDARGETGAVPSKYLKKIK